MPSQVALLLNPAASGGKARREWDAIAAALADRGVASARLLADTPRQSLELARAAVRDGVDALVAVGGDGTVGVALQAVAETETPLGIIPLGTGNDNARMLGIPSDPLQAVSVLCEAQPRTIDVAHATTADGTERYFLSVLTSGFDSRVGQRFDTMTWPKGRLRFLWATLAELRDLYSVDFRILLDGREVRDQTILAAVGNGVYYAGGMRICEGARIDDGMLTLTWLHECNRRQFLRSLPGVYRGTHLSNPRVTQHQAQRLRIEAVDQMAYAEGDRIGPLPVQVEVRPGGLQVLAPAG